MALLDAMALTYSESLRAAGDTRWPFVARMVLAWGVFAPVSYWAVVMRSGTHVTAVLCVILYIGLTALVLGFRFYNGKWRTIELTPPTA
ncbi:MAG: hypothetical protein R3A47_06730 [Polyangiales bacterium]